MVNLFSISSAMKKGGKVRSKDLSLIMEKKFKIEFDRKIYIGKFLMGVKIILRQSQCNIISEAK
jgi:hypothetical protein